MGQRVTYVTYDGIHDPIGGSQVLPYLRGLTDFGHRFHIVSFEKAGNPTALFKEIHPNIHWTGLRYHPKKFRPNGLRDALSGAVATLLSGILSRSDLVHVRSLIPGVLAEPISRMARKPLLFDMRGLWVDELVERGAMKKDSVPFQVGKALERTLLRRASGVSVLTNRMQAYLRYEIEPTARPNCGITVIPTCVSTDIFHPDGPPAQTSVAAQLEGRRVLLYLGSVGPRYRIEDVCRFYLAWRRVAGPSKLLVVSGAGPEAFRSVLQEAGCADELVQVSAAHREVPAYIRLADAGVGFFLPELASRIGTAPTKIGEMLACGIPVASSPIADLPRVLEGCGVMVEDFSKGGLRDAASKLFALSSNQGVAQAARARAETWFSMHQALAAYDALYQRIAASQNSEDHNWP